MMTGPHLVEWCPVFNEELKALEDPDSGPTLNIVRQGNPVIATHLGPLHGQNTHVQYSVYQILENQRAAHKRAAEMSLNQMGIRRNLHCV